MTASEAPTAKKKAKKMKNEEIAVGGARMEDYMAVAAMDIVLMEWEEWCSCSTAWMVGDEQMSWGTCWCPLWDVEFLGKAAYEDMYNDVVWDDDIWDLKSIKHIPN